jgi:hypothetical protein
VDPEREDTMNGKNGFIRHHVVKITALALVATVYGFTRLPRPSADEVARLAGEFAFTRVELPAAENEPAAGHGATLRAVHPSLDHIAAWISAVGASVALNDLDGDGLENDVCYVETRTDHVVVAALPGTGKRFETFVLHPDPLPYEPATTAPMGCLPGDFDENGSTDLLAYFWGRTPIAFLHRGEDASSRLGPDSYRPVEVVARRERWNTNAATRTDVDGDGHVDLVIGNYFPDGSAILDSGAAGDLLMQSSMSRAFNGGCNRVLLWKEAPAGTEPDVAFEEAEGALDKEVACGWTLAAGAADLDGDLLPELYFGQDFGPDRLLHNRSRPGRVELALLEGRRTFTTPSSKVLGHDSFKGMGVDFADVNGDGLLDFFVSNIAEEFALEESHFLFVSTGEVELMARGVAPYRDQSEALGLSRSGWAWDSRLADFNNDGVLEAVQATGFLKGSANRWPELHETAMGNDQLLRFPGNWHRFRPGDDLSGHSANPFFVRTASGRFHDVADEVGLGRPQVSRGIATADVDGDGDLDFAVANQWEASYLWRNDSPRPGAFLILDLRRPAIAGVPAIGATAVVHLPDGRRLTAQVDGGNGHSGACSPRLHFGLGGLAPGVEVRVELAWRDRGGIHRQTLTLPAGRHTVLLGESETKES